MTLRDMERARWERIRVDKTVSVGGTDYHPISAPGEQAVRNLNHWAEEPSIHTSFGNQRAPWPQIRRSRASSDAAGRRDWSGRASKVIHLAAILGHAVLPRRNSLLLIPGGSDHTPTQSEGRPTR